MDSVSVIIPASNEAALIGPCLDALLASGAVGDVQVVVVWTRLAPSFFVVSASLLHRSRFFVKC